MCRTPPVDERRTSKAFLWLGETACMCLSHTTPLQAQYLFLNYLCLTCFLFIFDFFFNCWTMLRRFSLCCNRAAVQAFWYVCACVCETLAFSQAGSRTGQNERTQTFLSGTWCEKFSFLEKKTKTKLWVLKMMETKRVDYFWPDIHCWRFFSI